MSKYFFALLASIFISGSIWGITANYLIKEMEAFRKDLPVSDSSRTEVTLRLADLYFNISIGEDLEEKDETILRANRLRALELYRQVFRAGHKSKRRKIEFQIARLLSSLGRDKESEKHYLRIAGDEQLSKKMKEQSFLALAEWYEKSNQYKKSVSNYNAAIKICSTRSICNYAYYRKGWLYFENSKLSLAIEEMKKSLWSSDSEVREPSLVDLILFMSNTGSDGLEELAYIEKLAEKLKRPNLIRKLTESYFVAGNRRAGSNLLAYLNRHNASLYYEVRLLEDFFGFKNWQKVGYYLKVISKRSSADIPQNKEVANDISKIFRRFMVQLDSEVQAEKNLNQLLLEAIDSYLTIYPNDELRKKMQEGWLKAQGDEKQKIVRLKRWIKENQEFGFAKKDIRAFRQSRLSLAQKLKMSSIVIEESLAISKLLQSEEGGEADKFIYIAARELYGMKEYAKALPHFNHLVDKAIADKSFGKWAVLSQNLILDIYNYQKHYQKIVEQVQKWSVATKNIANKEVVKEKASMNKILLEARFEKAVKSFESKESLELFFDFCFRNLFAKKSCANAKVLAVKFQDQGKLVRLLEREGDKKALTSEYEIMGRFSDAARLQEGLNLKKQGLKAKYDLFLKIALLYELDQNWSQRDRILKKMIRKMKKEKLIPKEYERVLFLTLDEAGLIGPKSFFWPWSPVRKLSLASRFEKENPSTHTKKLLLQQEKSQGPVWSKLILEKVQKVFFSLGKVKFYGRRSQRLFKKRTAAVESFAKLAKSHLNGADLETRIYLLHMLREAYSEMVDDILATPVPKGLDEDTLAQVKERLGKMASPFKTVNADYDRLLKQQLEQFKSEEDKDRVQSNLAKTNIASYSSFIKIEEKAKGVDIKAVDYTLANQFKKDLLVDPTNKETISQLLNFYKDKKMLRLATYYSSRLEEVGKL